MALTDFLLNKFGYARKETPWPVMATDASPTVMPLQLPRIPKSRPSLAAVDWSPAKAPEFIKSAMAMDDALSPITSYLNNQYHTSPFSEGIGFPGFPYLAQLAQRPEIRRVSEVYASEAVRKWIKLTGDPDRVEKLEQALERFNIRQCFREASLHDGLFGRAHIFIDLGDNYDAPELSTKLTIAPEKITKGSVKNFKVVEPFWVYPQGYETANPLDPNFYYPQEWLVMNRQVHTTRLLHFIGREVSDVLKPQYAFGGMSLSQMVKPYVDNWIRNRQSVSDLLHSFSTNVLKTNMGDVLKGGAGALLANRAQAWNYIKDNAGLLMLDKDSEEFDNVSAPLGTVDKLLAQSQEQIASVAGLPLVILLCVTPSGLNASSEGELRSHYDNIKGYQETIFRAPLQKVLDILQLNEFGDVDEEIGFEFIDLWEVDGEALARIRLANAQAHEIYTNLGAVSNDEVRQTLDADEEGPYFGLDLTGPAPEQPDDAAIMDDLKAHEPKSAEAA